MVIHTTYNCRIAIAATDISKAFLTSPACCTSQVVRPTAEGTMGKYLFSSASNGLKQEHVTMHGFMVYREVLLLKTDSHASNCIPLFAMSESMVVNLSAASLYSVTIFSC